MKKRILNILIAVLALVFVGSGAFVGVNLYMYHRQQQTFDELAEELPEEEPAPVVEWTEVPPIEIPAELPAANSDDAVWIAVLDEKGDIESWEMASASDYQNAAALLAASAEPVYAPLNCEGWSYWWQSGFEERQPVYQSLAAENPDVIGWVRIEGTKINYPVCQTPYNPEEYLHKDVNGSYSTYGTPFMDGACRIKSPRSSLLIYGHHMRNGSMFAALQNYTSSSYYRQHPFIQFDTLTEPATYQIALVIKVDAEGSYLSWQDLLFPPDEETFSFAYWVALLNRLYDTGVDISYGDELLALVTCEYSQSDGRLMVIGKRVW